MNRAAARITREVTWISLGQGISIGAQLFTLGVLTRSLTPFAFGRVALVLTAAQLVNQLLFSPVGVSAARFYATSRERCETSTYLRAVSKLVGLAVLVSAGLGGAFVGVLLLLHRSDFVALSGAASLLGVWTGINSVLDTIQVAARNRAIVALHATLGPTIRLILILVAATSNVATTLNILFAYIAGSVLCVASQYYFLTHRVGSPFDSRAEKETIRLKLQEMWRYAWPFLAWGGPTFSQSISDRWSIESFRGSASVGVYQAVFQIGYYPMVLVGNIVVQLLYPFVYNLAGDGTSRYRLGNALRYVVLVVLLLLVATTAATGFAIVFHRAGLRLLLEPPIGASPF